MSSSSKSSKSHSPKIGSASDSARSSLTSNAGDTTSAVASVPKLVDLSDDGSGGGDVIVNPSRGRDDVIETAGVRADRDRAFYADPQNALGLGLDKRVGFNQASPEGGGGVIVHSDLPDGLYYHRHTVLGGVTDMLRDFSLSHDPRMPVDPYYLEPLVPRLEPIASPTFMEPLQQKPRLRHASSYSNIRRVGNSGRRVNLSFSNDRYLDIQRENQRLLKAIVRNRSVKASEYRPRPAPQKRMPPSPATLLQRRIQQDRIFHENMV